MCMVITSITLDWFIFQDSHLVAVIGQVGAGKVSKDH